MTGRELRGHLVQSPFAKSRVIFNRGLNFFSVRQLGEESRWAAGLDTSFLEVSETSEHGRMCILLVGTVASGNRAILRCHLFCQLWWDRLPSSPGGAPNRGGPRRLAVAEGTRPSTSSCWVTAPCPDLFLETAVITLWVRTNTGWPFTWAESTGKGHSFRRLLKI